MDTNRKLRKPGLEYFIKFVRDLPDLSPRELFDQLVAAGYSEGQALYALLLAGLLLRGMG